MPDFNGSFVNMSQYCMNVPMAEKVIKSNVEHKNTPTFDPSELRDVYCEYFVDI